MNREEQLAKEIREITNHLNKTLRVAHQQGLEVVLSTDRYDSEHKYNTLVRIIEIKRKL